MKLDLIASLLTLPSIIASPTGSGHTRPQNPPPHYPLDQLITNTGDLGYAKYQGTTLLPAGINQWLGIRYAAPPLGDRRWREAQDPELEEEVQPALAFKPVCLGTGAQYNASVSDTISEDCLYLNIFAPANATTESKLTVWFFIQGGGYSSNADKNFNATEAIVRSGYGMVFVQINYRVGAYGFLASEKVRSDGALNVGLLDQRKALEWVQKYIHLFGGDPGHVVIYGVSAGAGSVGYQLTANEGRDDALFVGAIAGSPFWPTERSVGEMEFQFERFAGDVGCAEEGEEGVMGCLRGKTTEELQVGNVNGRFPEAEGGSVPNWYFLPVVDGEIWRETQSRLFGEGKVVKVPLIVGDDTDEGTYFVPNANTSMELRQFIKVNYPLLSDNQLEQIAEAYPSLEFPPTGGRAPYFNATASAYGEATFICPGIEMSRSLADFNSPAKSWNYRYHVRVIEDDASGIGVAHAVEKPAIWGSNYAGPCEEGQCLSYLPGGYNAAIVPVMMDYWISFILTLNPNTLKLENTPIWDPWQRGNSQWYSNGTAGLQRLKFETNSTTMETVQSAQLQRCELWRSLSAVTQQK